MSKKKQRSKEKKHLIIFIIVAIIIAAISYPLAYEDFRAHLFVTVFGALLVSYLIKPLFK